MFLDPIEYFLLYKILGVDVLAIAVFGYFERFIVVVKSGREIVVRVTLAIVTIEMVDPVFKWAAGGIEHTHAPFTHGRCLIAGGLENSGHGNGVFRKRPLAFGLNLAIGPNRAVAGVQAG